MNKISALAITLVLASSACTPQNGSSQQGVYGSSFNKQQVGTVLGGIGGGIAGNQIGKGQGKTAATIGGAILGGMLGNSVGQSMDRTDLQYSNSSASNALESSRTGTTSRWINPDSGNSGTITPTNTYQNSYGQYCREFSQTIVIGGKNQSSYGNACRQSDGSWQIAQ